MHILKIYVLIAAVRVYFTPTGREAESSVMGLAYDFGFYLGQPIRQLVELFNSLV